MLINTILNFFKSIKSLKYTYLKIKYIISATLFDSFSNNLVKNVKFQFVIMIFKHKYQLI